MQRPTETAGVSQRVDRFEIEGQGFLFAGHFRHPAGFAMDFHVHDFYEVTLVTGGRGAYEIMRETSVERIPVHAGSFLVWNGQVPHRAVDKRGDPLEQAIILFDDIYIADLHSARRFTGLTESTGVFHRSGGTVLREFEPIVKSIVAEQQRPSVGRRDMLKSLLTALLVRTVRFEPFQVASFMSVPDDRIVRAVEYGLQNFEREISLSEIASVACVSTRRFTDLFHQSTGYSWTQFVNRLRISEAQVLLRNTAMSITEVGHAIGYSTTSLFCRWFSRVTGASPADYRKNSLLPQTGVDASIGADSAFRPQEVRPLSE